MGRWGIAVRVLVGGVLLLGRAVGVGVEVVGVRGVRRGGVVVVEGGDVEVVVVVVGAVVEVEDVESHFVSILDVK